MTLNQILNDPLKSLNLDRVRLIAEGGVQEDGVTEFKGGLDEGSERDQKPWAEGGKLSRNAKNDLMKAIIAFANAYGGTLYVGIRESDEEPKRSCGLAPLPRIFELETTISDSIRELIEPRLPSFDIRSFDFGSGNGVLVLRVPRSPVAPHWNSAERQPYQRIGASSMKIGMREVQSITLDRARTAKRTEDLFEERDRKFRLILQSQSNRTGPEIERVNDDLLQANAFAIRCTCIPLLEVEIDRITARDDLRIGLRYARVKQRFAVSESDSKLKPRVRAFG